MFGQKKHSPKYVRTMPKIYGNLQRPRHSFSKIFAFLRQLFGVALLVGLVYLLFYSPLFEVKRVEVQGAVFADQTRIKSAVPLEKNIFAISKNEITARVLSDPIISSVGVFRGLPDDVRLVIGERQPSLIWITDGTAVVVDDQGYAFSEYPKDKIPTTSTSIGQKLQGLPRVTDNKALPVGLGHQIVSPKFTAFLRTILAEMKTAFPKLTVDHFEITDSTYDVTMFVKEGMQVQLNSLGKAEPPIHNLALLYGQKKISLTSKVDLRIDRWAYVQ